MLQATHADDFRNGDRQHERHRPQHRLDDPGWRMVPRQQVVGDDQRSEKVDGT
jgi:hypothetical protein